MEPSSMMNYGNLDEIMAALQDPARAEALRWMLGEGGSLAGGPTIPTSPTEAYQFGGALRQAPREAYDLGQSLTPESIGLPSIDQIMELMQDPVRGQMLRQMLGEGGQIEGGPAIPSTPSEAYEFGTGLRGAPMEAYDAMQPGPEPPPQLRIPPPVRPPEPFSPVPAGIQPPPIPAPQAGMADRSFVPDMGPSPLAPQAGMADRSFVPGMGPGPAQPGAMPNAPSMAEQVREEIMAGGGPEAMAPPQSAEVAGRFPRYTEAVGAGGPAATPLSPGAVMPTAPMTPDLGSELPEEVVRDARLMSLEQAGVRMTQNPGWGAITEALGMMGPGRNMKALEEKYRKQQLLDYELERTTYGDEMDRYDRGRDETETARQIARQEAQDALDLEDRGIAAEIRKQEAEDRTRTLGEHQDALRRRELLDARATEEYNYDVSMRGDDKSTEGNRIFQDLMKNLNKEEGVQLDILGSMESTDEQRAAASDRLSDIEFRRANAQEIVSRRMEGNFNPLEQPVDEGGNLPAFPNPSDVQEGDVYKVPLEVVDYMKQGEQQSAEVDAAISEILNLGEGMVPFVQMDGTVSVRSAQGDEFAYGPGGKPVPYEVNFGGISGGNLDKLVAAIEASTLQDVDGTQIVGKAYRDGGVEAVNELLRKYLYSYLER